VRPYNLVMDQGIAQLADSIYRERVERARRRSIADKLLDGGILFEHACEIAKAGIRSQNPQFDEDQVRNELRRRLGLAHRLEALDARSGR
jgi:hypothetical protein